MLVWNGVSFFLKLVFGSADDVVLNPFAQIRKIDAVAGHPDHERRVFFRALLGIDQGFFGLRVELNMLDAEVVQSSADEVHEVPHARFLVLRLLVGRLRGVEVFQHGSCSPI